MEIRTYPINDYNLYACNLKLHISEILALHYDSEALFEKQLIQKIKEQTAEVAERIKNQKENV